MIVVTTPTGNIGGKLLPLLLEGKESVRVIVRDAGRLPAPLRDRVDIIEGSHADPKVVDKAFRDAESVFWLAPPAPQAATLEAAYLDFTRPAAEALRTHRVRRVVAVSNLGRGTPWQDHAGVVTANFQFCDLIAAAGVDLRALALPGFMDNLLLQAGTLKSEGLFFHPLPGERQLPTCSSADIAGVAARLLIDRSWTGVSDYPVLGPEDLSMNQIADILAEVLGKPIRFRRVPLDDFRAQLLARGMSEAFAGGMVDMMAAKAQGLDNAAVRTPEATTPTTLRHWAEVHLRPAVLE